jgi:uncharacterized glyoxalase superfamily protein PhnB
MTVPSWPPSNPAALHGALMLAVGGGTVMHAPTLHARRIAMTSRTTEPRPPSAAPRLAHLAPVLVVESVEPCLSFWTDRFGFAVANRVPGPDGRLVFASVERDGIEVMYQTRESVAAERPESAAELVGHSVALFITVDDIDAVEKALAGAPVVAPRHRTFYGSTEIYVREPGGNTVGFAQMS